MSKSVGKVSEEELDEHPESSVYDFLYCDTRRIGSYLSQFDNSGLLEKVIQRESASKGSKRGYAFNLGGGATLVGTGGSGNLGLTVTPAVGGTESSERVYDPYWANARAFLDFLEDAQMLVRDLNAAGIGQFVLASGSLSVIDIATIKRMFSNTTLKKRFLELPQEETGLIVGGRLESKREKELRNKVHAENVSFGFELVSCFPFTVQTTLITKEHEFVWSTLNEECMTVKAGDLFLQHGIHIQGEWNVVGILDAKPSGLSTDPIVHDTVSPIIAALTTLGPVVRPLIGRPDISFGLTPLLIFRDASG
jgi:hypothetical protein